LEVESTLLNFTWSEFGFFPPGANPLPEIFIKAPGWPNGGVTLVMLCENTGPAASISRNALLLIIHLRFITIFQLNLCSSD
jgi:hypothetical protein